MIKAPKNRGFTLVELLLAMAFFSFILMFMTTGFIIVNRAYNKGITAKLIQDEGRRMVEDLTRTIRSSNVVTLGGNNTKCFIASGNRYFWNIGFKGGASNSPPYKLFKDNATSCSNLPGDEQSAVNSGAELMLHKRVGVQYMSLESVADGIYKLKVVLSTSDSDLISNAGSENVSCNNLKSGNQYCDVVKYSTVISSR